MSRRLLTVAGLLALGLACDPAGSGTGYAPFDTDPDGGDDQPQDTLVDSSDPSSSGGGSGSGGNGGPNNAPRANAAANPSTGVKPGDSVSLDASGSTDVDGDQLAYRWELTTKPTGSNASVLNPTFEVATLYIDKPGNYAISLTVTDGKASGTDALTLRVDNPNQAPTADAGPDLTVDVGQFVQLSGANSSDPDGDTLEYYWSWVTRPPGSVTDLQGISIPGAALTPSFVTDVAGTYVVKLEVSDGDLRSRADLVNIVARTPSSGGSGTIGSGGSGSSCGLGCTAQAAEVASNTWTAGDLAGGFGLLALPVLVALWQRRRDDEQA